VGAYQRQNEAWNLKPEGRGDPSLLLFIFWDCVAAPSSAVKHPACRQWTSLIFQDAVHHAEDHQIPAVRCKPRLPRIYTGAIPRNYFLGARLNNLRPADGAEHHTEYLQGSTTPRSNTASQSCIAAQNTPGSISTRNELSATAARHNIPAPADKPLAELCTQYTALQHEAFFLVTILTCQGGRIPARQKTEWKIKT
jgi:hypothetical protein